MLVGLHRLVFYDYECVVGWVGLVFFLCFCLQKSNQLADTSLIGNSSPLVALLDWWGYRLICYSELPIGPHTLVYGSADGGKTGKWTRLCLPLTTHFHVTYLKSAPRLILMQFTLTSKS